MGLFDYAPGGAGQPGRRPKRGVSWEVRLFFLAPIYLVVAAAVAMGGAFVYYTTTIPDPMVLRHKANAPSCASLPATARCWPSAAARRPISRSTCCRDT
jgi:hypothetical protein